MNLQCLFILNNQSKDEMVKIRLTRCGRKQRACYRIVAIDVRFRREGRALQKLGWHDPASNQTLLNGPAIRSFLVKGAKATKTVSSLLRKADLLKAEK